MEQERGSVAVEFALVLPFLVLLVVGGWVLGYLAYTKMALAMVANRAARDLAVAREVHGKLSNQGAVRFDGGFSESFGLPRWGLHALALKSPVVKNAKAKRVSDHAVTVAVCYRVPFTVPFGVLDKPVHYHVDTSEAEQAVLDVAEFLDAQELETVVEDYRKTKRRVEEEASGWGQLWKNSQETWERTKDLGEKAGWIGRLIYEFLHGPRPDFRPYHKGKGVTADQMESTVAGLCAPPGGVGDRSIVLTSRATYLMQDFWQKGDGPR